jgi:hypothetical protein
MGLGVEVGHTRGHPFSLSAAQREGAWGRNRLRSSPGPGSRPWQKNRLKTRRSPTEDDPRKVAFRSRGRRFHKNRPWAKPKRAGQATNEGSPVGFEPLRRLAAFFQPKLGRKAGSLIRTWARICRNCLWVR